MYHGIILDFEFKDPLYPESFKIFAKQISSDREWILYGVEVSDEDIDMVIQDIQRNMKSDEPYYAHFYNEEEMIVVFKEKVFKVASHSSSWSEIIKYGKELGIPEEQLDFWPNRFQDEKHYFKKEEYI